VFVDKQMQAVGENLPAFKQSVRTDDNILLICAVSYRTSADGHISLTLAYFETAFA